MRLALGNFFDRFKSKENVNIYGSMALCITIVFLAFIMFFAPFATGGFKVSPFNILRGNVPETAPDKVFDFARYLFIVFIAVVVVSIYAIIYLLVVRNSKAYKITIYIIAANLIALFAAFVTSQVCVGALNSLNPETPSKSSAIVFLVFGFIIFSAKFVLDMIYSDKEAETTNLANSSYSMFMSFLLTSVVIGALFIPLYILSGKSGSLSGIGIISGGYDTLTILPATALLKTALIVLVSFILGSFILSLVLYMLRRGIFVKYYRYHTLIGWATVIMYMLAGIFYVGLFRQQGADLVNIKENTSIKTFSYIPLILLTLFVIVAELVRLSKEKLSLSPITQGSGDGLGGSSDREDKDKNKEEKEEEEKPKIDPIPAFSELDNRVPEFEQDLQQRRANLFRDVSLPKLIDHVIEYAKYSDEKLSYNSIEMRTFVAGLAASRLSILQGLSGTGKTSLPRAFMRAIDGLCEMVAVESSWRDKNELLGYYNEFSGKYTPKTFTQSLYKASLNSEVPTFIVLDELNLSRIEYYFSDFLSLMEEPRESNRRLKLFDVQLYPDSDEAREYLALDNGHTINIPTNLWFIATANRDESTFEISDKVYDRAQTINFYRRAIKAPDESREVAAKYVPYRTLRELFIQGEKSITFDAEQNTTIQKIEKLLQPYQVTFGNRILKQMETFVKVFVACCNNNNNPDELAKNILTAIDCIMFSKVLRKLEYKMIDDELVEEFTRLNLKKCVDFLKTIVNKEY